MRGFLFLRSFAGTFYLLSSVGVFLCTFSQVVLPWVFSAGGFFSALLGGVFYRAVFRTEDVRGLIPVSFFRAILCSAFLGFLHSLFRRGSFRASFCKGFFRVFCCTSFCVPSIARLFSYALSHGFSRGLLHWDISLELLLQGFPHGLFPGASSLQTSAWTVSMDAFAGSFTVLSLGGGFFVQFFPGLSPCNFCREDFKGSICGGFFVRSLARVSSVRFSAGNFYLHCLVGYFFVLFFCMCFSRGLFRSAFSMPSFVGLFSLALFRSGDIDQLIPRRFFCALLRSGFFYTLFRRSF